MYPVEHVYKPHCGKGKYELFTLLGSGFLLVPIYEFLISQSKIFKTNGISFFLVSATCSISWILFLTKQKLIERNEQKSGSTYGHTNNLYIRLYISYFLPTVRDFSIVLFEKSHMNLYTKVQIGRKIRLNSLDRVPNKNISVWRKNSTYTVVAVCEF